MSLAGLGAGLAIAAAHAAPNTTPIEISSGISGKVLGGVWALAWVRALPALALVPAFGLRALATPSRAVLGLGLAAAIVPALEPRALEAAQGTTPWLLLAFEQLVIGLPVALAAAIPLWAATMAGGLADGQRGASDATSAGLAVTPDGTEASFGTLLSLLASAIFLATGGPARVADALATAQLSGRPLLDAAQSLTSGITLAIAIGGPLLAASVVIELALALVARAAHPARLGALLAPLRALGILAVVAVGLPSIAELIARAARTAP